LAPPLQQGTSTLVARVSTASTRSHFMARRQTGGASPGVKLTFHLDHSMGAGQTANARPENSAFLRFRSAVVRFLLGLVSNAGEPVPCSCCSNDDGGKEIRNDTRLCGHRNLRGSVKCNDWIRWDRCTFWIYISISNAWATEIERHVGATNNLWLCFIFGRTVLLYACQMSLLQW
jgi:hypothetical protein